jgi:hypothetical protein
MKSGCFLSKFFVAFVCLSVSTGAVAAGSGTIIMNGKRAAVTDAYAYRHVSAADRSVTLTTVVVSDRPIDEKKLAKSDDRDKTIHAQLKQAKAVYWEGVLGADGHLRSINAVWPGVLEIKGSGDESDLHITRNDAAHLEGWYRTLDEEPKDLMVGVEYFDLKFSIDF